MTEQHFCYARMYADNSEHRRDQRALFELMALLDDSDLDSSSSSDEEDMDFLLCELSFKPKRVLGPRLNLDDLSSLQCEQLFRSVGTASIFG